MGVLATPFESESFIVDETKHSEIEELQELYESSSNTKQWDGNDPDKNYISQCYFHGDLPPNGRKENYKLLTIRAKSLDKTIIGMVSIYHGFPTSNIAYIAFMCMRESYKNQGFGQEIIKQLSSELTKIDYKEIRINVALKNWSALRFWHKTGFDKINGIFGDKEYSEQTYSSIELVKYL